MLLLMAMLWVSASGQEALDVMLGAGLSAKQKDFFTTANIAMAMVVGMLFVPVLMYFLQRRPALFWGGAFLAFSFSEARFPGALHALVLGLRYAAMLAVVSLCLYLVIVKFSSLNRWHFAGLMVFLWSLAIAGAHGFGSNFAYVPAYFAMMFAVPVIVAVCGMDESYRQSVFKGLVWASVLILLVNISSLKSGVPVYVAGRFVSYYPLPTNFANNFILSAAVLWVAAVWNRSNLLRLAFAVLFLVACGLVFLSGTRNAMLCLTLMVVVTGLFFERKLLIVGAVVGVLAAPIIMSMLASGDISDKQLERLTVNKKKEERSSVWQSSIDRIGESPWIGYGPDLDIVFFDVNSDQMARVNPHNVYLGFALRLGVIGLALYLVFLLGVLWRSFRLSMRHKAMSAYAKPMGVLAILWVLILSVSGMFEDNLTGRGTAQQLGFGIAVGVVLAFSLAGSPRQLARGAVRG